MHSLARWLVVSNLSNHLRQRCSNRSYARTLTLHILLHNVTYIVTMLQFYNANIAHSGNIFLISDYCVSQVSSRGAVEVISVKHTWKWEVPIKFHVISRSAFKRRKKTIWGNASPIDFFDNSDPDICWNIHFVPNHCQSAVKICFPNVMSSSPWETFNKVKIAEKFLLNGGCSGVLLFRRRQFNSGNYSKAKSIKANNTQFRIQRLIHFTTANTLSNGQHTIQRLTHYPSANALSNV